MFAFIHRFRSPNALVAMIGLWLLTVGNSVLWTHVAPLVSVPILLTLAAVWFCVWLAIMQWLQWPWVLKAVMIFAVLTAAFASYFMSTYGVVIDPSMMRNALATDTGEALDLLSARLLVFLALIAGPPLWLIARWPIQWAWTGRALWRRFLWSVGAFALAVGLIWSIYGDFASIMRNDHSIRYQITPFNVLYSGIRAATPKIDTAQRKLLSVGDDARVHSGAGKPPLLVLVVGETARASDFGLGGYGRDTTPHMQRRMAQGRMVYWKQAESCGTNTEVSVPCMFSPLTAAEGADQPAQHQNLMDVLAKAGLGVYWVDNQSGCKGVCDRVPHIKIDGRGDPRLCSQGDCFDEALVQQLDLAMSSLSSDQRKQGVLLVLHQMGSHGPAYFKRSPTDAKPFLPECTSAVLAECSPEALRNTYDNSIAYTDKVLEQVLQWLEHQERAQRFATAMVYVSDHGESLGEKGLYLHGAPRWMAPKEQTHIPMLAWYSQTWTMQSGLSTDCLMSRAEQSISHDFLFHSVLGMLGVKTRAYQPVLDWSQPCMPPSHV
jgi:lipid A ethanolaminephosphotransferase